MLGVGICGTHKVSSRKHVRRWLSEHQVPVRGEVQHLFLVAARVAIGKAAAMVPRRHLGRRRGGVRRKHAGMVSIEHPGPCCATLRMRKLPSRQCVVGWSLFRIAPSASSVEFVRWVGSLTPRGASSDDGTFRQGRARVVVWEGLQELRTLSIVASRFTDAIEWTLRWLQQVLDGDCTAHVFRPTSSPVKCVSGVKSRPSFTTKWIQRDEDIIHEDDV